jgi:hypothetical protein
MDEIVASTIEDMNTLCPMDIYTTLHERAAKGTLKHVVTNTNTQQKNKVSLVVIYKGIEYKTAGHAGQIMRQDLRDAQKDMIPKSNSETFDAFNRMKIIFEGQVIKLNELLPKPVRQGEMPISFEIETKHRKMPILQHILNLNDPHLIIDGSSTDRVSDTDTDELGSKSEVPKARHRKAKKSTFPGRPVVRILDFEALLPFITTLRHYCQTNHGVETIQDIFEHVQTMAPNAVEKIAGVRLSFEQ